MPQAQVKNFPGFGIVYPGGGERGIKVVKTFTKLPRKYLMQMVVFHMNPLPLPFMSYLVEVSVMPVGIL